MRLGVLRQRFLQDLLGLRVAAVRHVDVGFGDRVDFLGLHPGAGWLTEACEAPGAAEAAAAAGVPNTDAAPEVAPRTLS